MRRRFAWGPAIVVMALFAVLPATASAATLRNNAGTLEYRAAAGEVNQLVITRVGSDVVFTDAAAVDIVATAPCAVVVNENNRATCPAAGVTRIDVDVADLNDLVDDQVATLPATITGGTGGDELRGAAQNDLLSGGDGTDTLRGRGGNDDMRGGPNTDTPPEQYEELIGGPGNDRMLGGPGRDDHNGEDGIDTADYSDRAVPVNVTMGNSAADDGQPGENDAINVADDSVENVLGGGGQDTLIGDVRNNRIDGGPERDTIDGGDGIDWVLGGPGNDVVRGGPNPDPSPGYEEVHGGPGDDLLDGGTGKDDIVGNDGTDTVTYASRTGDVNLTMGNSSADDGEAGEDDAVNVVDDSVEDAVTGGGNDRIVGTNGNNILGGGGGRDTIDGLRGADEINGFAGDDDLTGGDQGDVINGQAGDDTIRARDGFRDTGECGDGNDTLYADIGDAFGSACETVTRSFAIVLRIPRELILRRPGIPLRVACPIGASKVCTGVVRLETLGRIVPAARAKRRRFGSKRFRVRPGKRKLLRVRVSRRNRALVRRRGRIKLRATVTGRDAAGKLKKRRRTFVLRAP